jgi:hypothetical protein
MSTKVYTYIYLVVRTGFEPIPSMVTNHSCTEDHVNIKLVLCFVLTATHLALSFARGLSLRVVRLPFRHLTK